MFSKRHMFVLLLVLFAILAVTVVGVLAQDDDDTVPPFGRMGRGMHGMMRGPRMMWSEGVPPMLAAAAEALDTDVETLLNELQTGKTLSELAEEAGVELDTLSEAVLASMTEHLNALVEAGYLTQEQADARLSFMQERWETMPMFSGGCPMGGGHGMGMMHGGMMGRGWRGG